MAIDTFMQVWKDFYRPRNDLQDLIPIWLGISAPVFTYFSNPYNDGPGWYGEASSIY